MNLNDKILAILPHSIAGRLIVSSMKDGFEALGFSVDVFDEIYGENFKEFYLRENYPYLLSYDFTSINLKFKHGIKAKTLNFFGDVICDPHSGEGWNSLYGELFKKDNLSFLWDIDLFEKEDNPQMTYLPHFVNTDIYKNLNYKKKFDVMFMGRLDTDCRLKEFEKILENFSSVSYYSIEKHYKDALRRLKPSSKALIENAYQGFIDNEGDMARAICKAKIVVNFNEQGISSLNYRTIQTMASETMHIGDFRQDGVKYFGENYIYYENSDDMVKKIKYYLCNLEDTDKIVKNIRRIIEANFSHRAGVRQMLEFAEKIKF